MTGPAKPVQIGQVAERLGLSLRTLRHYDDVGLVPPSARSEGGFRLYTEVDVARLELVKRMKPLGFTLEEMRDLLGTLAALAEGPATAPLLERLAMFSAAAEARVTALREELAVAEGFAATLVAQQREHAPVGAPPLG